MAEEKRVLMDLSGLDDRAVQKVLRELDSAELASALLSAPEEISRIVFRNMSGRAGALLREDMKQRGQTEDSARDVAAAKVNTVIEKLIDAGEIRRGKATSQAAPGLKTAITIDTNDLKTLRESLLSIGGKARAQGLFSLEDDVGGIRDAFLKDGLQLMIDGTDPAVIDRILRTDTESYERTGTLRIREATLRMEREQAVGVARRKMILDGILSIQSGDIPHILARKLAAYGDGA